MLRFNEGEIQILTRCVRAAYGDKKIALINGVRTLEKLVNSKVSGDKMPKDIDETLKNNLNVWDKNQGNFDSAPVEGVLRKIVQILPNDELKPVTNPNIKRGLAKYYTQLGIMEELENAYSRICPGRTLNADVQSDRWTIPDRSLWTDRQYDYVCVWRYRNRKVHSQNIDEQSSLQTGFFSVLIDTCNRFQDKIEEKYSATFRSAMENEFVKYKEKLIASNNRKDFFENEFTELYWGDKKVEWTQKCKTILLLGEAGAGKTTQMEKLYWDELESRRAAFPIWLEVRKLVKEEGFNQGKLEEYVRKNLGDVYEECYEPCMEQGFVSLYIDGLNEITMEEKDQITSQLLQAINNIRKEYPKIRICLTDRRNQLDIKDNIQIYTCSSMSDDKIAEYCEKKWGVACRDEVMAFLEKNEWFSDPGITTVTPEKINGLAEIFKDDEVPKDEDDYYFKYLDHILKREEENKSDKRVRKLKPMFYWLTLDMEDGLDQFYSMDIVQKFAKMSSNNISYAVDIFDLACDIPIIEKQDSGKYGFVHPAYYNYFHRKDLL